MTDQELADAIRNSYHFVAGWFANPPTNSIGSPIPLETATGVIASTVRGLLHDNPPWVPAEGEEVRWEGHLWAVEHIHDGHAYLLARAEDHDRYRAPLSELTQL